MLCSRVKAHIKRRWFALIHIKASPYPTLPFLYCTNGGRLMKRYLFAVGVAALASFAIAGAAANAAAIAPLPTASAANSNGVTLAHYYHHHYYPYYYHHHYYHHRHWRHHHWYYW